MAANRMTEGVMRQRYVDGFPHAFDLTNIDNVPSILRDLSETWRRVAIGRKAPGTDPTFGCAEYVDTLADMIDRALLAQAERDAARWAILCDRCDSTTPATMTNPLSGEHMCGDCYHACYVVTTCVACGDTEPCRPSEAGEAVCDACRPTWEGE